MCNVLDSNQSGGIYVPLYYLLFGKSVHVNHQTSVLLHFCLYTCVLKYEWVLSPYFGQIRRWAAIKMGLEDIRAIHCWIGLARGFGLNCPCICIIMLEYDSV
jgi:hypothetical protein